MAMFKLIKWYELTFLLLIILLMFFSIVFSNFFPNSLTDKNEFAKQIFYAVLTAVLTTILFRVYSNINTYYKYKKNLGYWLVFKFQEESYEFHSEYVIITTSRNSLNNFDFYHSNVETLNTMHGKIYMNAENKLTEKLLSTWGWINNTSSSISPMFSYNVYIDESFNSEKIIRVFDDKNKELYILQKDFNQKKIIEMVKGLERQRIFDSSENAEDFIKKIKQSKT